MLETQQALQDVTIYGWPKALAASAVSISGGLISQITDVPWTGIIMAVGALVPPILKVIFDHRLRSKAQSDQSQLAMIDKLKRERELERNGRIRAERDLEVVLESNLARDEANSQIMEHIDSLAKDIKALKDQNGEN